MKKLSKAINALLNGSIVLILSVMVLLVFLNAVMRYLFHSGITWSEELSRYSFVWLVFLGAVVAFKEGSHIIVDLVVSKLPEKIQKATFLLTNIFIIGIMILFLDGLTGLMELNKGAKAPASGIHLNTLYIGGALASVSIIGMSIYQAIQVLFFNKGKPAWMLDKASMSNGGDFK
ncbi:MULTISPECIES: TRAP transporter small permease [Clostridia]|uniref:TRAP transporter small permease n=1 Tax=Clostridia TaxID=186801 RepID=UPI000EA0C2B5|nr:MULTISPECIES: TRAP transporter small permease [Clostridia]NBJ71612.1 TRAP transporter small permease [Roseburia sp. 1XD42-34]RKI76845.1 TRAP transporter small permease [Clostridium sp. 1xD42-85]